MRENCQSVTTVDAHNWDCLLRTVTPYLRAIPWSVSVFETMCFIKCSLRVMCLAVLPYFLSFLLESLMDLRSSISPPPLRSMFMNVCCLAHRETRPGARKPSWRSAMRQLARPGGREVELNADPTLPGDISSGSFSRRPPATSDLRWKLAAELTTLDPDQLRSDYSKPEAFDWSRSIPNAYAV